ncbi:MAG TPA: triose-phosphate isomerase [Bryobacteraceae bacterium]|jgi:triosephosphate isomerase
MSKPLMAGNWKMYKTPAETRQFFAKFNALVAAAQHCEILICPPALNLTAAVDATKGSNVMIGAQNLYPGKEGAFTGEISGYMIHAVGCTHVIIGHSERRQYFHDSDAEVVLKKTVAALEASLTPVVCVGEMLAEREGGKTEEVLIRQFREGLGSLTEEQFAKVVVAYEPVWAIGTGKTATPQIASDAHAVIRKEADALFGKSAAKSLRILYGGSVKPDNAKALMAEEEINGVLVGGASLDAESFAKIVNY